MKWKKRTALTSKQVGIKYGFRSGLEDSVAEQLNNSGVGFDYEETKLSYIKPEKSHTYTPDFYLPKQNIFIETKGLFTSADRQKMRLIKDQYPDLDIRFVFSNSRSKISKRSKTTYGMWCEKYGFLFADKLIPEEWLE
tara:strand:+ start:113 stop:526 length:414 start_codon:yes stop_codon:yes gene_type:complete